MSNVQENYGGIFINKPFSPNIKCIIISTVLVIGYLWTVATYTQIRAPHIVLSFILFVASYVLVATYDVMYDCSDRMRTGTSTIGLGTFDSIFKSQLREDPHSESILRQEQQYQRNVYLFHILLIVPILFFVSYQGLYGKLDRMWFAVLGTVGLGALAYHGVRLFYPRLSCNVLIDEKTKEPTKASF